MAGATPTYKSYTSGVQPASIFPGQTTEVAVTLTNSANSNQSFGSAEVAFGGQSTVAPVSNSAGWAAGLVNGAATPTILLTSAGQAAIPPDGTLTVEVNVTPSGSTSIPLTTTVKQSNNFQGSGNDFNRQGPDPVITVLPVTLSFGQGPPPVVQQSTPMCGPVTVDATYDQQPVSGITVTLTNGSTGDPGLQFDGGAVGSAGITAVTTDGVATFGATDCSSGLSATKLGSGFTLTANSASATGPVTSSPFMVVQSLTTTCDGTCTSPTVTSPTNDTSGSATSDGNGNEPYTLLTSFGQGGLGCDDQVTTTTADPLLVQTSIASSGEVTLSFPKKVVNSIVNNGTPQMQVCARANYPFPGSALAGQTPTGTPFYEGLLANCPTGYSGIADELCVVSRNKNAANEIIVIYASDLSDPSFW